MRLPGSRPIRNGVPARVHGGPRAAGSRRGVSGWPGMPPSTLIENVAPGRGRRRIGDDGPRLPPESDHEARSAFDWNP